MYQVQYGWRSKAAVLPLLRNVLRHLPPIRKDICASQERSYAWDMQELLRMNQATRQCPNCKKPVSWLKVRPPGSRRARFCCIDCGAATKRIKGRRKKDTMPAALYGYRQKVKIANDLWRHLVYKKSKDGRCARCGRKGGLQAMHIFPKGKYPHLRFDLDNGIPGCAGCHIYLTNEHEAHRDFCIGYLGERRYEDLRMRSLLKAKCDVDLVIVQLRNETGGSQNESE